MNELQAGIDELAKETDSLERDQFKDFCKKYKFKSVRDFEQSLGKSGDMIHERSNLEKQIERSNEELQFCRQ